MNKWGIFSLLTVAASIISFFILRGPNADLPLAIIILGSLSLLGIIFAVISKRWLSGVIGVLLNGAVLVCAVSIRNSWLGLHIPLKDAYPEQGFASFFHNRARLLSNTF